MVNMTSKSSSVWLIGGGVAVLYLMYSVWPSGTKYHQHHGDTWRTHHRVIAVPEHVEKLAKDVRIIEKSVTFDIGGTKPFSVKLFYLEAKPVVDAASNTERVGPAVILLHGQGDSSQNWLHIGTLHLVASTGHRVIALDLLGHGKSSPLPWHLSLSERRSVLQEFLVRVGVVRPILVPVSMGGSYALPYVMEPAAKTCVERVAGFVPVAIVSTDTYTPIQYHKCEVPTMIVFGVNDTRLGLNSAGNLRNLKNNEIVTIEKAGHACHHQQPRVWHEHLYNYLTAIR